LVPQWIHGWVVSSASPSLWSRTNILTLLVIEVQFHSYPVHNLVTIPTELSSLLELEIGGNRADFHGVQFRGILKKNCGHIRAWAKIGHVTRRRRLHVILQ